ncbi:MAG: DMT family transporter [Chitinophagaceae bacterium]|jgi:drug/metabolite transporter (DMT)-like permease
MKKAFVQLHVAIFLAGFTGVLGRLISMDEASLVWYRMGLSSFILFVIGIFFRRTEYVPVRNIITLFLVGGIMALHWTFFYGSIKYSNVSVGLVCFSMVGFFSSIIEPILERRRPNLFDVALGLTVVAGVYLIFHFDTHFRLGILLGFISSFLAALFTFINKHLVKSYQPHTVSLYELTGGFLILTFILPFYLPAIGVQFTLPTWSDLFWLLFLSLFCTVLALSLSVSALKHLTSFTINLSYNLELVYGMVLAFLIYHEHQSLGFSFYSGLSIIVLTVVVQTLRVYRVRRTVSVSD